MSFTGKLYDGYPARYWVAKSPLPDLSLSCFTSRMRRGYSVKRAITEQVNYARKTKPKSNHPFKNSRSVWTNKSIEAAKEAEQKAPSCCGNNMNYIPSEDRFVCRFCHTYSAPYRPSGDRIKEG